MIQVKSLIDTESYNHFNKLVDKQINFEHTSNSIEELIEVLDNSYTTKSKNYAKYFNLKVSQKFSILANKPIIDYRNDGNQQAFISFRKNLTYIEKDNQVKPAFRNELIKGEFLSKLDKQYANKKIAKVKYLEKHNEYKEAYFLTWTLPSKYHKYKLKKYLHKSEIHYENPKILELNPNFEFGNYEIAIVEGIKLLNEIHRYFYKFLKKSISRDDSIEDKEVDFIKVIEPHKSGQAHQHSLFWVDINCNISNYIENAFNHTIKKFNLESKYQDNSIINKNISSVSTYITKYLLKSLSDEEFSFYSKYKRYFGSKNKFFSSSNFKTKGLTQKKMELMYNYLKNNFPEKVNAMRDIGLPIYYGIEILYNNRYFSFVEKVWIKKVINTKAINKILKEVSVNVYKQMENEYKETFTMSFEDIMTNNIQVDKELQTDARKYLFRLKNQEAQKIRREFEAKVKYRFFYKLIQIKATSLEDFMIEKVKSCIKSVTYNKSSYKPIKFYEENQYINREITIEEFHEFYPTINVDFQDYQGKKNFCY
jgi:hypothetical protein